ncbi:MAG: tetratricopeptide repeat protein [Beijerinckiaceae bacterium]|nr:tetratricopeptide repeat protein [Beijerinckiaceae bacterium]
MFDKGRDALKAGDDDAAAGLFYAALEKLREQGRGETVDAGLVTAYLAGALDRSGHPRADNALALALALLARAEDPAMFIETTQVYLSRLQRLGRPDEGAAIVQRLLQRMTTAGVSDDTRINAMNVAYEFFSSTGQAAQADTVLETLGPLLEATTPRAARLRGIARLGLARASRDDGRVSDFATQIEGAIADLRRALPQTAAVLGGALMMRGKILVEEGLYVPALDAFAEAAGILRNAPDSDEAYVEASGFQARMLTRIERNEEALAIIEQIVEHVERQAAADVHGQNARLASAARLDRVEMLMNAGRRQEALKALEAERERLGDKADPFIAGQFFEKLAAILIEEENYPEAAQAAERALDAYRQGFPNQPALLLEPMRKRAQASEGLLDTAYGERAFGELIALSSKIYRPKHPEVARDLNGYAGFLENAGRLAEAEGVLRRSLAGLERAYGGRGRKVGYAMNNLGKLIAALGRHGEAVELFDRALAIFGEGKDQAEARSIVRINYANSLNFLSRSEEAMRLVQEVRADLANLDDKRERYANGADMLGMMTLAHMGRLEESWREGAKAFERLRIRTKEDARNAVNILLQMADVARRAGDDANALAAGKEASQLMVAEGIETDRLWREWAQITLPSLWRKGQK